MNQEQNKTEHPGHDETYDILVNGTQETFTGQFISYNDVVKLAFGSLPTNSDVIYAVSCERGENGKEGTLFKEGK